MVFSENLSLKAIEDLKKNIELLALIGSSSVDYFTNTSSQMIQEDLNIDYTSTFIANSHPLESAIRDAKVEIASGMENPVFHFYTKYGFEINLLNTPISMPDHLSIELGFMQTLVYQNELEAQKEFMQKHIIAWMPIYLIGVKKMLETPFYRDVVDFAIDFLLSDYEYLKEA
jgi:putative dimethyl sulfoxide reductase chaperone